MENLNEKGNIGIPIHIVQIAVCSGSNVNIEEDLFISSPCDVPDSNPSWTILANPFCKLEEEKVDWTRSRLYSGVENSALVSSPVVWISRGQRRQKIPRKE